MIILFISLFMLYGYAEKKKPNNQTIVEAICMKVWAMCTFVITSQLWVKISYDKVFTYSYIMYINNDLWNEVSYNLTYKMKALGETNSVWNSPFTIKYCDQKFVCEMFIYSFKSISFTSK